MSTSRNCHYSKGSSIDQRIEYLFGHLRENFHGEISRWSLGPQFGDYGTFLPTRLIEPKESSTISNGNDSSRSSMVRNPNGLAMSTRRIKDETAPTSQNSQNAPAKKCLSDFSDHQNSGTPVKAVSEFSTIKTYTRRLLHHSFPGMAESNTKKQAACVKTASPRELAGTTNSNHMLLPSLSSSVQKGVSKSRIETGERKMEPKETSSVIRSTKEELYHSLGMDLSPYSSPKMEQHESSTCSLQISRVRPVEYPTRIIKLMPSSPISGSYTLSPLKSGIPNLLRKRSYQRLSTDLAAPSENKSVKAQNKSTFDKNKGTNSGRYDRSSRLRSNHRKTTVQRTEDGEKINKLFSEVLNPHTQTDKETERSPLLHVKDEQQIELEMQAEVHAISVRPVEEKSTSLRENQLEGRLPALRKMRIKIHIPSTVKDHAKAMDQDQFSEKLAARSSATMLDNWVECDKCLKWRLLPCWVAPNELPSKWTCSKITWLAPGMNSCQIRTDDSTAAVRELHQTPMSNQVGKLHRTMRRTDDIFSDRWCEEKKTREVGN